MPGELVTAASILAGSGVSTWVADKLLGPSFDGLGEQFRAYAGQRITKILKKFQSENFPNDLNTLPPGFAIQFFQKASFSEDDDLLTAAWASLLSSASRSFENRHMLFADILSVMSASDAKFFEGVFQVSDESEAVEDVQRLFGHLESHYPHVGGPLDSAVSMVDQIRSIPIGFPCALRLITVPYSDCSPNLRHADHVHVWRSESETQIDVLVRNGLLREFSINLESPYHRPGIEGVVVTALGNEFHKICAGEK